MAKLLKVLIVLMLLLSIASLVLGIMLFNQREILKGRTQNLEQGVSDFARSIHQEFNVETIKSLDTMRPPLVQLAAQGENLYEDLQQTKADLARTEQELADTKDQLAQCEAELEQARKDIARLENELNQKIAELAQARQEIAQLQTEKSALETQVSDLEQQLSDKEEVIREKDDEIAALESTIRKLDDEYGNAPVGKMPEDLSGKILFVNPDWNFVILGIGSKSGLVLNAELLVSSNEELIGKVRVTDLREEMAVAEILPDWTKKPIKEGDYVLRP